MHRLLGLRATLGAFCGFLCQISGKVGDVSKVEVGMAGGAAIVAGDHVDDWADLVS